MAEVVTVVHGGAGRPSRGRVRDEAPYRAALEEAVMRSHAVLETGGRALDAVQAAVVALEDSPVFNAGRGSVLNEDGEVEMDAAIMCGRTRRAGAVACVSGVRNPVMLAREVLVDGRHVLLAGPAAETFAHERGLERAGPEALVTDRQRRHWERWREGADAGPEGEAALGTVGAVARDRHGNLAAATSTGGVLGKRRGRVGDSPLIGAGSFADDRSCAVSCTGEGEAIMRAVAAHEVAALVEHGGRSLAEAGEEVIGRRIEPGADAGLIAVGRDGQIALPFNTPVMNRGWRVGTAPLETAIGR